MSWFNKERKIMAYNSSKKAIIYSVVFICIIEWILYGYYITEKNAIWLFLCFFLGTIIVHLILIYTGIIFSQNTYGRKTLITEKDRRFTILIFSCFYVIIFGLILPNGFVDYTKEIIEKYIKFERYSAIINGFLAGLFLVFTTLPFLFINGIFFLMSEKSQSKMGRSDEE